MNKQKGIRWLVVVGSLALFVGSSFLILKHVRPYQLIDALYKDDPLVIQYHQFNQAHNDELDIYFLIETRNAQLIYGQDNNSPAHKFHPSLSYAVERLKRITNLEFVHSLLEAQYFTFEENRFIFRPFVTNQFVSASALALLKSDDVYHDIYLSKDQQSTLVFLKLPDDISRRERFIVVQNILATAETVTHQFSDVDVHVLGVEAARFHFVKESVRTQMVLFPLALLIILIVFWFLTKSIALTLASVYILSVCYAVIACVIVLLDGGIGIFSGFALLFIFIIGTSDLVHFNSALSQSQGLLSDRLKQAANLVFRPCLFTSITTFIGLLCLGISDVRAMVAFVLYCTLGLLLAFGLTFFYYPLIIRLFKLDVPPRDASKYQRPAVVFHWIETHTGWILGGVGLIIIIASTQLTHVRFDHNIYKKLSPDHQLSQALTQFQRHFDFSGTVDLLLTGDIAVLLSPVGAAWLQKKSQKLAALKNVSLVRSLQGFNARVAKLLAAAPIFPDGISPSERRQSFFDQLNDYDLLAPFGEIKKRQGRIMIHLQSIFVSQVRATKEAIEQLFQRNPLPGIKVVGLHGSSLLGLSVFERVVGKFSRNFLLGIAAIFLAFFWLFRDLKFALLAMIPNIIPIWLVVGFLGWRHLVVDYNFMMLAAITVGIAVDDTIHFMYHLQQSLTRSENMRNAISDTLGKVSKSLSGTTLIFILTFPILLLTDVLLFKQLAFGIIAALLIALLADLVFLPAILIKWNKRFAKSSQKH